MMTCEKRHNLFVNIFDCVDSEIRNVKYETEVIDDCSPSNRMPEWWSGRDCERIIKLNVVREREYILCFLFISFCFFTYGGVCLLAMWLSVRAEVHFVICHFCALLVKSVYSFSI